MVVVGLEKGGSVIMEQMKTGGGKMKNDSGMDGEEELDSVVPRVAPNLGEYTRKVCESIDSLSEQDKEKVLKAAQILFGFS